MPSEKKANKPSHITTGNVLEDLGFSAEEIREIVLKHDLWVPIRAEIEGRKLTQTRLAKELQIHQPDASLLLRGQIERFSVTRLLQFADRLGLVITLSVGPKPETKTARNTPRVQARRPSRRREQPKRAANPRQIQSRASV
jgi:predicted XRE-type DNA-binding protein